MLFIRIVKISCGLFFFEQWTDHAALAEHFKLPASRLFAKKAFALADGPPKIEIYEAFAVDRKE